MVFLEEENQIMFVQSNEEQEDAARYHAQGVGDWPGPVTSLQLWEHGDQGDIEEDPDSSWQEPGGEVALGSQHQTHQKPQEGEYWGEEVVEHRHLHRHPRVEEKGEVPHLVGQLVAEDGNAGGEAGRQADREGGTNRDTVGLVKEFINDK